MGDVRAVIRFDAEQSDVHDLVGGKAASLGRLTRAGFPVPPGFTVATTAYASFMHGLSEQVQTILAAIDYSDQTALESHSERLRRLITESDLPEDIAAAIVAGYRDLFSDEPADAPRLVAVRSSGTAEDLAQASFAGLHDTYLDIEGEDAVLDAVKRCFASLWTARAIHYRHDKGFAHQEALLAVVIQKMIPAQVAGVMFTANPLNLRTDEFVINASWGLGEGIVSGILTPDEFIASRHDGQIKKRTLGSKAIQIVRNPDGGTMKEAVLPDLQVKYSLDAPAVEALCELGRAVMHYYDSLPQDLEWAWLDDQFYLLQSRRVTGAEFTWDEDINDTIPAYHDESTVWTSTWADDFLTGGVTPLYYSVRVGGEFQRVHDYTNRIYKFPQLEGQLIFKYRRATAYFNCDVEKEFNIVSLPSRLRNVDYVPYTWDDEVRNAPFGWYRFLRMMVRLHVMEPKSGVFHWLSDKPGGVYHYLKYRVDEANGPSPDDLKQLSDAELEAQIERTRELADEWVLTLWAGFNYWAVGALGALAVALEKWYDGDNESAYQDLISGMPNTLMMQESRAQWHLAKTLRETPTVMALFNDIDGPEFFTAAEKLPEAGQFLREYREFLNEHGHRGHQDRDIYYLRRIEDPAIDYRMLRAYLAAGETADPRETEKRLIKTREKATDEVLENIRKKSFGAIKVALFRRLLVYVHKFLVQRDDERHYYDRITYQTKKVYAELGRRMFQAGLFEAEDDFYFLARQELYELKQRAVSTPLTRAKIEARKRVFHRRNRREEVTPPYLVGGDIMEMKARTEAFSDDGSQRDGFRGLGTAAGSITGIARVVPNLAEIGRVQKGDILITNSTDPGWAPVFSIIGGLVLETGGLLAHGACLSREYGLPSVLLRHAMSLIEDGAEITIDGSTGTVTVASMDTAATASK